MRPFSVFIALAFVLFLTACITPKIPPDSGLPPEPPKEEEQQNVDCFDYERNGVLEKHCAECGNNICEPFEGCVPTVCDIESCSRDCGPLYCPEDCGENKEKLPPNTLPEITAKLRTCNLDSDCIMVSSSCCGCTMGGQADAVSKKYENSWKKTLNVKCANVACLMVVSNHWTCFAEPKCVKNKCTLVKQE